MNKDVEYFINLVLKNKEEARNKKSKKARENEMLKNINIKSNGEEIIIWNEEKNYAFTMYTEDIIKMKADKNTKEKTLVELQKGLALKIIDELVKYTNNEITIEKLIGIEDETKKVVKDIISQKNNISEQLKLLRKYRNIPEVQEYIDKICESDSCTEYVRYLIDKYYYNKKDLIKPEKTGLECWGKLQLK